MTPYELRVAVEAYEDEKKDQQQLAAVHASWIMSMWSKRPVKPHHLIKTDRGDDFVERSKEQIEEAVRTLEDSGSRKKKSNAPSIKADPKKFKSYAEFQAAVRDQIKKQKPEALDKK